MSELDKFTSTVAIMAAIIYANEPASTEGAVRTAVSLYEEALKVRTEVSKIVASKTGIATGLHLLDQCIQEIK